MTKYFRITSQRNSCLLVGLVLINTPRKQGNDQRYVHSLDGVCIIVLLTLTNRRLTEVFGYLIY